MNGIPWELDQLPRGQPSSIRARKTKDPKLYTMNEWLANNSGIARTPEYMRRDTAASNFNLTGDEKEGGNVNVNKARRDQLNALAKVLLPWRRP